MIFPKSKKHMKSYAVLEIINKTYKVQNNLVLNTDNRWNDDLLDIAIGLQRRDYNDIPVEGYRGWLIAQKVLYKHLEIPKQFVLGEQLAKREINDYKSSQWASAKILIGDQVNDYRPSCNIARECMKLWNEGNPNFDIDDPTEKEQFEWYLNGGSLDTKNPENMPLAVVFNEIDIEAALTLHPTLINHESHRDVSIINAIKQMTYGNTITSDDHRVVKAIAMYSKKYNIDTKFLHPECVNKSNPRFWSMLKDI